MNLNSKLYLTDNELGSFEPKIGSKFMLFSRLMMRLIECNIFDNPQTRAKKPKLKMRSVSFGKVRRSQ